jgi:hypothetical protein
MTEQEKLDILIPQFIKLDEPRKDYIRDLTRKLADIHRPDRHRPEIPPGNHLQQKEEDYEKSVSVCACFRE